MALAPRGIASGTNGGLSVTNDSPSNLEHTPDVVKPSILFLAGTVLGVSSTVQAYWAEYTLHGKLSVPVLRLFLLNLIYWYVPALAAPLVIRLALRLRESRRRWPIVALMHVAAVFVYSCVHTTVMVTARVFLAPIAPNSTGRIEWWRYAEHEYLEQLDWLLMTYLFLVGLAYALAYRRESEARALNAAQMETRAIKAQLRALQTELRPHFLFNTLNTISGLMRADPDAADLMIDRLADLLRLTLNAADTHPLHQELAIVGKYLDIEQARFRDRLAVVMDVTPDALDALVPSLVLQPLVENAVRHGIAPHARPGVISLLAARVGTQLMIHVRDTGDGAPPGRLVALNSGIGLGNTRARLAHLYANRYRFEFANTADGFSVMVGIPFQVEPEAAVSTELRAMPTVRPDSGLALSEVERPRAVQGTLRYQTGAS